MDFRMWPLLLLGKDLGSIKLFQHSHNCNKLLLIDTKNIPIITVLLMWKQDHFHTRKSSWSEKLYFTRAKGSGSRGKRRKESRKSNKQLLSTAAPTPALQNLGMVEVSRDLWKPSIWTCLPRTTSRQLLNTSKEGNSTTSLGNLSWCLATRTHHQNQKRNVS